MPATTRLPLVLGVLALAISVAGVVAPRPAHVAAAAAVLPPVAPNVAQPGSAAARGDASPFELVLFGNSQDGERLKSDAQPLLVYRVPDGFVLWITDVDATTGGLVLWRGSLQQRTQVGFVVDRAAVGLGQSASSYVSGIRFGPGDELLVGPAGSDVEWAALRGVFSPSL